MDREEREFFLALFDSFQREMHQEFDRVFARPDRIEARPEPQEDPECERWNAIGAWAARPSVSARYDKQADI